MFLHHSIYAYLVLCIELFLLTGNKKSISFDDLLSNWCNFGLYLFLSAPHINLHINIVIHPVICFWWGYPFWYWYNNNKNRILFNYTVGCDRKLYRLSTKNVSSQSSSETYTLVIFELDSSCCDTSIVSLYSLMVFLVDQVPCIFWFIFPFPLLLLF